MDKSEAEKLAKKFDSVYEVEKCEEPDAGAYIVGDLGDALPNKGHQHVGGLFVLKTGPAVCEWEIDSSSIPPDCTVTIGRTKLLDGTFLNADVSVRDVLKWAHVICTAVSYGRGETRFHFKVLKLISNETYSVIEGLDFWVSDIEAKPFSRAQLICQCKVKHFGTLTVLE